MISEPSWHQAPNSLRDDIRLSWGRASLRTEERRGRTVVTHQYSQAPLQWLGPLDPQAERPMYYLRNPNGGLLGGDRHEIELSLGRGTQLEIRTQGATRLHAGLSTQQLKLSLEPESTLIWISHPLIPGAGSCFRQQIQVHLSLGARLAYADIWTAGRIAMGERWQFDHLLSTLQIQQEGKVLLWECLDLKTPHLHLNSPAILGNYPCWGSLYLMGEWGRVVWPLDETHWSLTAPHGAGGILRQVGDSAEAIWETFKNFTLTLESAQR